MSSELALARSFFTLCKNEIVQGGDYRARLIFSSEFRTLNSLIPNAMDIITKAEGEADVPAFLEKEMAHLYRDLREVGWSQRNFSWPMYRDKARMVEAMSEAIEEMKRRFPEMASMMSDWAFRAAFVRAAYATDREILVDWEKRYGPIRRVGA
jgi:hypothetical protein